ncbi:transcription factor bHLH110-like [Ananas comosus]|uniref:Transcription factor bHLH110-like n=1 Tax=Ananas comosus TaxID=4615 RepID=A0A6P5FV64_ANACO|nr:transcription factor bHLH110-like [Ananas comosus]XP_020096980.1 transcription factor bHLH110-like [Ananas comosus]
MMDSSNHLDHHHHHYHHHQEGLHGSSLEEAAAPLIHCGGTNHGWNNQPLIWNCGDFNVLNESEVVLSNQREFIRATYQDEPLTPPLSSIMVQDLGFQWCSNADTLMNQPNNQSHLARIKEELPTSDNFPKLNGLIKNPTYIDNYQLSEKLFLKALPQNGHNNALQPPTDDFHFGPSSLANLESGRGGFSMVLPSVNISLPSLPPLPFSGSLDMDLQALLASTKLSRSFFAPPFNSMAPLLKEDPIFYGPPHVQEAVHGPFNNNHKVPCIVSGVSEAEANCIVNRRASQTVVARKPRIESRSSFSSFKVRKEKLGDRIAALQQLVAPFGKTDTASVLMEAIGYIKFLQEQVKTLSVPYMRPSNNKKLRTTQGASNEEKNEPKLDLRSRGLCLVPLSCTSYVTNENGGMWSPSNYRGSA